MKRRLFYLFSVIAVAVLLTYVGDKQKPVDADSSAAVGFIPSDSISGHKQDNAILEKSVYERFFGETLSYNIRSLGMRAGSATVIFEGLRQLDGRDVYLITFEATALNFSDIEKIYADPTDFYPVRVVRDLNIWGSVEKIVEDYDQEKFSLHITKTVKGKEESEHTVIKKDGKIDNIYCFIYRFRAREHVEIGQTLQMNLPTKDVMMNVVRQARVSAVGQSFESYFLRTDPAEYSVWFAMGAQRFPLRIDRGGAIGGTSMVLTEHKQGSDKK